MTSLTDEIAELERAGNSLFRFDVAIKNETSGQIVGVIEVEHSNENTAEKNEWLKNKVAEGEYHFAVQVTRA